MKAFSSVVAAALALALTPAPADARSVFGQSESRDGVSRSESAIADFYHARDGRPLWFAPASGGNAADQLITLLDRADIDGLDRGRYLNRSLVRAMRSAQGGSQRDVSRADMLLSRAFVAYVRDLRGSGSSGTIFIDPELRPAVPQAREILQAAAAAPSLPAYVDQMGWMSPIYGQIRNAFANQGSYFDQGGAAQLVRINLERARALPVDYGQRYVIVDAAAARLYMYENGRVYDSMKVVVGKPTDQTPMLAALMRHAIVNPYWNVPPDLAAERIAPHVVSEGISYFHSKRYQVLSDWSDNPRVVDPTTIDWQAVKDGRIRIRVRQLPGPDNAMGKVKFEFPNPQGIYLHDTNDPKLFDEAARLFSGGCVRIEAAQRLAKWLYGKPLVAKSSKPEQKIPLTTPVPVYITYLTVGAENGRLAYRQDVYNRDGARMAGLANALK
jgi:murein L,D-transpeptidase YcbB/YkuD